MPDAGTEDTLRSAEFYRALLENAPGGIALVREATPGSWRVAYADKGTRRLFGYANEEIRGFDPSELTHPDDVARVVELLLRVIADPSVQTTVEYRFRQKDGTYRWIESVFTNMLAEPSIRAVVINFRDISERKAAEAEAETNAAMFRIMADQAPVLIWRAGTDKLCYYFNKVWLEFTGKTLEQEKGNGWAQGVHPEDYQRCLDIYVTNFARRQKFSMEYRLRRHDGVYRWILDNGSPVFDASGEFTGYIGSCVDISDLKQVERALKESERRLRTIVDNEPECVKIVSPEGRILDMNAAGLAMLELSSVEEASERTLADFIAPDHKAAVMNMHKRVIGGESATLEFEIIGRKGTHRWLETHAVPLFDENHQVQYHLAVTRDVTDKRSLAQQLLQSQKLSSLGTLASGIAHNFNNILAIILGYLPRLEKLRADPAAFSDTLASVQTAAERATALVQQMLAFGRKADFRPEPVQISSLLSEIATMLSQTFPRSIAIECKAEPNLPSALFDSTQFHQVIMNLCINARDAMQAGGKLSLHADLVSGSRLAGRFPEPLDPEYIRIVVQDTGTGMDEAVREKVFEPFFTTKNPGHGTGLGLSVVYGILHQHHGFIEIESEPGNGTRITLYIPTTQRKPQATPAAVPVPASADKHLVLIIEDEDMLREITEDMLTAAGYQVITASDGPEGIAKVEANPSIALVISDLGLPSMSGEEVVNHLREVRPGIKIIVCSGFIDPASGARFAAIRIPVLQKPYRAADLLNAARAAVQPG